MRNINVQLTIDRHVSNGSAYLNGKIGDDNIALSVKRGASDGDAKVTGDWGSPDSVDLVFTRDAGEGYTSFQGKLKGEPVDATLNKKVGGDSTTRLEDGRYEVDRDRRGENVDLSGTDVRGDFQRELRDGDEQGVISVQGERIRFSIDREPKSGDFEISGTSSDGRFRLNVDKNRNDGDLSLSGSMPEGAELFPLFWEILGDDKNIPDKNPYYPGSLLGMSLFVDQKN